MALERIRKIEELDRKVGGRFRLSALMQRRLQEVIRAGVRPLEGNREPINRVIAEIDQGAIDLIPDDSPEAPPPAPPATDAPRGPAGPPATF